MNIRLFIEELKCLCDKHNAIFEEHPTLEMQSPESSDFCSRSRKTGGIGCDGRMTICDEFKTRVTDKKHVSFKLSFSEDIVIDQGHFILR